MNTTVILITLVVYKVLLLAIGLYGSRQTHDAEDFFLGGRRLGPLVASISASASSSSAWTLLGVSGYAYTSGLQSLWLIPGCCGGFWLNWYVVAPALRKQSATVGAITLTEFIAGVGPGAARIRVLASLIILASLGLYVAAQFNAAGLTFSRTFSSVSSEEAIVIGGGVVLLYTLLGGFWAVSLTDTVQGLVMAATAVVLPVAALIKVGGWSGLSHGLATVEQAGYMNLLGGAGGSIGLGVVIGLLAIGLGYPGQPHVVNRFMALKSGENALRNGQRWAMSWAVTVYCGMVLLGLCGRVLLSSLGDGEAVFIVLTTDLFPSVLAGVLLAAVLSAIMSTADSQLLVAASSVTHDLGFKDLSPRRSLAISRTVIVLLSLAAMAAAIYGEQSIFQRVLFAWTAMGAAFGPLLFARLFGWPVPSARAFVAMAAGAGVAVGAHYGALGEAVWVKRLLPYVVSTALIVVPPRRIRPQ